MRIRIVQYSDRVTYDRIVAQVEYCMGECAKVNDCKTCPKQAVCQKSIDLMIGRLYSGKPMVKPDGT